jgi:foldase protein PrsA
MKKKTRWSGGFGKYLLWTAVMSVFLLCMTGCAQEAEETKVILTTGFKSDEVFRIESASCSVPEVMVYLTNTQNRYESIYDTDIWKKTLDGMTLEENVKNTVLAELAQIKVMNLLAAEYEVTLQEKETKLVQQAGKEYFSTLNETEITAMGVDEDIIIKMYEEYAVANKVYQYIIKDINPEISDDEARTITIEHILIKTHRLDSSGQRTPLDEEEKKEAYEKAVQVLTEARNGEDFESLVSRYNEDGKSIYSFGKGEMEADFERAAFNLGTGEISDIVETAYGYHIIKCISTFNREETDANKVKIVEQRRKEVFSQEYDAFAGSLARNLNTPVWEEVALIHDSDVKTTEFFKIYNSYFHDIFGQE